MPKPSQVRVIANDTFAKKPVELDRQREQAGETRDGPRRWSFWRPPLALSRPLWDVELELDVDSRALAHAAAPLAAQIFFHAGERNRRPTCPVSPL